MSIDVAVQLPCAPRTSTGGADPEAGTRALVRLLRLKGRADAVEEAAIRSGKDPEVLGITIREDFGDSAEERQVTLAELRAQHAELGSLGGACTSCPANVLQQPFGCCLALHYPIAAAAERWLHDLLSPPSVGARLRAEFMHENRITAAFGPRMRERGLFELRAPLEREHRSGWFRKHTVTTDHLFEYLFGAGEGCLGPDGCLLPLIWCGALSRDGRALTSEDDLPYLQVMANSPADRVIRTALADFRFSTEATDGGVEEFRNLFAALHAAWANNVPLYCWA